MTMVRVLYVVVCGAGPDGEVGKLVELAQGDGWDVHLISHPGRPGLPRPRHRGSAHRPPGRDPGQPRLRTLPADAIIVAPATYNAIGKLAHGIADNYALGVLAECVGIGVPATIVPFINSALARRALLLAAVTALRDEGVRVLLGPDGFEPHPPSRGGDRIASFPWGRALAEPPRWQGIARCRSARQRRNQTRSPGVFAILLLAGYAVGYPGPPGGLTRTSFRHPVGW